MARVAQIASVAHYVPQRRVGNEELDERFTQRCLPGVVGKYQEATGIRQRFYAPDDWATSDLALPAAREAIKRAGLTPDDIDLVIVGTDSPDYVTPATSVVLQHKLGARNAGTFDVGCACASFPATVGIAAGILATNPGIRRVLVVGVYLMHKLADPDDISIFFYGDGAGAVVMTAGDEPGFVGMALQADGSYADCWGIFAGGTAEPASVEAVKAGRTQVRLTRRYPPEVNKVGWPKLFRRLASENGFTADQVDHLICTQVSHITIRETADELGIPLEKCPMIMGDWGYTGSACIPMALSAIHDQGRLKSGDLVVMIGSGVGYNQAACAIRM